MGLEPTPLHLLEEVRCDGESRFGSNDGVYSAPRAKSGLVIIGPFFDFSWCKSGYAAETATETAPHNFLTVVVAVPVRSNQGKWRDRPDYRFPEQALL